MSISIIKPGKLDTLQDTGRFGFSNWGIHPRGAMDRYAAQVANMLTGNEVSEAVIEMHYPGPQILFEQNALIAITGADFSPMLNDEPLPLWQPVAVRRSTILHFPALRHGALSYLAVHGGFTLDKWPDSEGNHLKVITGEWHGHKLEKNDELSFGESNFYVGGLIGEKNDIQCLPWKASIRNVYRDPNEIFMTAGPEYGLLTDHSKQDLEKKPFHLHPSSGRNGYYLKGASLHLQERREPLASGTNFGAVQLLPNGQLMVQMADHQPTSTYPRIGYVISAHLPKLVQLRPGEIIELRMADIQTAEELLFAQQQELNILRQACYDHLSDITYP